MWTLGGKKHTHTNCVCYTTELRENRFVIARGGKCRGSRMGESGQKV